MGTLPKDVTFTIPEQFRVTNEEQEFIIIDHIYGKERHKRIILFSSPEQFQLLCRTTQLFADGTFAVTPRPFKQTYIIQALHESGFVLPVAWILLNDKKKLTYQLLFKLLQSSAEERKIKFYPIQLMTDFETAVKSAFTILYPKTIHDGCFFHYLKSIVKRLKKYGLWNDYLVNDDIYLFVKKLMSLPMLKPDLMMVGFKMIEKELDNNKKLKYYEVKLNHLFSYYYHQWLKPGYLDMVNVYGKEYRTNNFSEMYNAALKLRMTVRRPSLWQFIKVLILEETGVRIKLAQIDGGILKSNQSASSNSSTASQITQNIIDINKNLSKKKISLNEALIELSRLIGLKYQKFRDERRGKKQHNINSEIMTNNNKYYILTINTGSEYQCFDDMLLHIQDDPKYAKKWPCIISSDLLKQLDNFMSNVVINEFGTDNGVLFVKPTRRQVDGSHRYYFCKEPPDGKVFLYKKMGAGEDKGKFFKIFTNKEETVDLLTYVINYMKHNGEYPIIKQVEKHYEDAQVMIARERIQIVLNVVHSGVDITHRKTSIDYAIDLLPKIKAVSTTTVAAAVPATTVAVVADVLEQNNDSESRRSSLSSSTASADSPPPNNNAQTTKRTDAAVRNSSLVQITGRSTPMRERLRTPKQAMRHSTSPSSNTTTNSKKKRFHGPDNDV
ncbi:unnamed protein product, partial [Rotaria magnacalcarata]